RPERPLRACLADDLGGDALVFAVVPLGEILGDLGDIETGQRGRAQRPLAGTRQDRHERAAGQRRTGRTGLIDAGVPQVQVRVRGVLAVRAPLGLPVPDENDLPHAKPSLIAPYWESRSSNDVVSANGSAAVTGSRRPTSRISSSAARWMRAGSAESVPQS